MHCSKPFLATNNTIDHESKVVQAFVNIICIHIHTIHSMIYIYITYIILIEYNNINLYCIYRRWVTFSVKLGKRRELLEWFNNFHRSQFPSPPNLRGTCIAGRGGRARCGPCDLRCGGTNRFTGGAGLLSSFEEWAPKGSLALRS